MLTTAQLIRYATSAKFTRDVAPDTAAARAFSRAGSGSAVDTTVVFVTPPARMIPTMKATAVHNTNVISVKRLDIRSDPARNGQIYDVSIIAWNLSSERISTPRPRALSSLLPASAPSTR